MEKLQEDLEKLKRGLIGPTTQRFKADCDPQLSMQILAELLGREDVRGVDARELSEQLAAQAQAEAEALADGGDGEPPSDAGEHRRTRKSTGRKTTREELPKITLELLPDEVRRLGTEAFERIGEESCTTTARRVSALVEVTVLRAKFRAKTPSAIAAV